MTDDIDFTDISALKRIQPDTVVEKFGGLINSSFFDASNVLGTLKIKGLVDFTNAVMGQSAITVTDEGKRLLEEADAKSSELFDNLDYTLLTSIASGKRTERDVAQSVNIRSKDLAMHLNRLEVQGYMTPNFRNGSVELLLTEKGFSRAKVPFQQEAIGAAQQSNTAQPVTQATPAATVQQQRATTPPPQTPQQQAPQAPAPDLSKSAPSGGKVVYALVAVIIILIILIALAYTGVI